MKIVKILLNHSRNMGEEEIKSFLQKNLPGDILHGLEHDDPKTISRTLKLLGISANIPAQLIEEEYHHEAADSSSDHHAS